MADHQSRKALTLTSSVIFCFHTGLQHEQKHPDRDKFVSVHQENIEEEHTPQYDKQSNIVSRKGFDYHGIMIYGEKTYGINGKTTMTAKDPTVRLKEPHEKYGLSEKDIEAINELYNCTRNANSLDS